MTERDHELGRLRVDKRPVTTGQVQKQDADHGYMMHQVPQGVTVPPELCRTVARLAVLGLADRARRDGGTVTPGLAALLRQLDGVAATGSPEATMGVPLLTVAEAAETAGVSQRRVRQLAASGRLRSRRYGRPWLIELSSAEEYRRERQCQSQ